MMVMMMMMMMMTMMMMMMTMMMRIIVMIDDDDGYTLWRGGPTVFKSTDFVRLKTCQDVKTVTFAYISLQLWKYSVELTAL